VSRYRSCIWKPLDNRSTKALQKDILCWHTMVSTSMAGTWGYFNTGAGGRGVYSHGLLGGGWGTDLRDGLDGVCWQAQDTDLRAASNLDGNWRVIAFETADNAARPIQPWTPKQCAKIVEVCVEANQVDGIPLQIIPDSRIGRRGIAYHRLGCDPYRVSGGELWSSAYGKDCPTDPRIKQLPALVDQARRIVAGQPEEDDVTPDEVKAAVREVLHLPDSGLAVPGGQVDNGRLAQMLVGNIGLTYNAVNAVKGAVAAVKADTSVQGDDEAKILAKLAELQADVEALASPTPPAGA
jgi:hypothetical protein